MSRLPVDSVPERKGEFYLRQFLNDEEASLLLSLIPGKADTKPNHMVAAFRQMSTFQNILDMTRRCIKESLSRLLSIDIQCIPISGKHKWDLEDESREREETILLAISPFQDGHQLMADIMSLTDQNPVFKMWFGSNEVQGHVSMRTIFNRPFLETTQRLNIRRISTEKHTDMISVHRNIQFNTEDVVALLKEYSHPQSPSDVWLVLLKHPRPLEIVSDAYGDRPQGVKVPWPGKHGVLTWEGGNVGKHTELNVSEEPTFSPFKVEESWLETSFGSRGRRRKRKEGRDEGRSDSEMESRGNGSDSTSKSLTSSLSRSSMSMSSTKKGRKTESDQETDTDTSSSKKERGRKVVIQEAVKDFKVANKILVRNIAWGASENEIMKIMEEAGKVSNIQILRDSNGKDKGHRVVEYQEKTSASTARKSLNNREIKGRAIHITSFKENDKVSEAFDFVRNVIDEAERQRKPTVLQGTPSSEPLSTHKPDHPSPPPPPAPNKPENKSPNTFNRIKKSNSKFKKALREKGLKYIVVKGDGFCLFHAVAECLGRSNEGQTIKNEVLDELKRDPTRYKNLLLKNGPDEDGQIWDKHLKSIENQGWGVEPEMAAIQTLYNKGISIWYPGEDGTPIQDKEFCSEDQDAIILAYYPNKHYNALRVETEVEEDDNDKEIEPKQQGDPSQEEGPTSDVIEGSSS